MALGEAIISALGLVRDNTGVADLHRTLRLGTYCPLPGYRVPVFLTIQLEPDDFRRVIETLVVDNDESFVVLAPTQELFSPACEKWLQKRKARFLSLVDFLTMQRNGTLVPRVSSEELFTGVREAVIPTVAQTYPEQNTDPKSLNRFVLQSGYWWSITYRGKTCVLKDTKGMHYLEMLIRKQGQELHVSDLYYLINRRPTQTEDPTLSVMTEEALDEIGLTLSGLSDAGEAIDETAKKQIRTRLKQIEEKIEEAKEFGNEEAQFKREQEREQLIQYLSSSLGFSGRTRRSIDPIERIRKTVSNAIQRTCKAILEDSPELGRHLTNSLSTGSFCAYKPEAPTYWSFS